MSENEFWIKVWKIVGTVVSIFILTVGGCTTNGTYIIKDMVEKGASPIQAACAVHGIGSSNEVICIQSLKD